MFKKILLLAILSILTIACDNSSKNETKPASTPVEQPARPSASAPAPIPALPSIPLIIKKVVQSVGFSHKSGEVVITNSYTGEQVQSCGKTNLSKYADKSNCSVEILEVKQNQEFIRLLEQINNFKQPVLIKKNGKTQTIKPHFLMMANYVGSCGSLSSEGGKQHESEVDCFSTEEQSCHDLAEEYGAFFVKENVGFCSPYDL